jgi:hypothetical protein
MQLERIATAVLVVLVASTPVCAGDLEANGHVKTRAVFSTFPDDSLFRDIAGANTLDLQADLRLNLQWRTGPWDVTAAGQLVALHGERIEFTRALPPEIEALSPRLPDDRRRYLDLSTTLSDSGRTATVARLDRFSVGWTGARTVVRLGRQTLSWGNGFFYAPMDLVNPFDPATIDTEFKPGDDMLYVQHLFDNGNDLQGAVVGRRNPLTGESGTDLSTAAVKYHGFAGDAEYDVLLASHYADPVIGLGGSKSLGGAIVRGDVVLTSTDTKTVANVVVNFNYSWVAFDRNMTGAIEYYYNGFGQTGHYDLTGDPDLFLRLIRGDLFTLGRQYLAGTVTVEISPLWTVTPVLLANLQDPSCLIQLTTQGSLGDNAVFIGTLSLPVGPGGSEFGGLPSGQPGRFLATGPSLFAQFAWYF